MPDSMASRQRALGDALRQIRREKGFTQEALHLKSGVHRNQISAAERGGLNPSHSTLLRLADALEVRLSEIIALSEGLHELRSR